MAIKKHYLRKHHFACAILIDDVQFHSTWQILGSDFDFFFEIQDHHITVQ